MNSKNISAYAIPYNSTGEWTDTYKSLIGNYYYVATAYLVAPLFPSGIETLEKARDINVGGKNLIEWGYGYGWRSLDSLIDNA